MLFNSYTFLVFLLLFSPIYYFLNSKGRYIYLLSCGAFFFGNIFDFLIFLASVLGNGIGAFGLKKLREKGCSLAPLFTFLVCLNVMYLAYFKYFFVGLIPLAISFYTFEQITFLYFISYSKEIRGDGLSLKNYLLFISFFPRLLAGPIYYYDEYKDKLQDMLSKTISWEDIGRGFSIFCLGLFKKVVCASQMALIVDPFYENPGAFSTLDTWFATLAYSLQIYFDFSAYSEMAVGVGMIFGIILPLNFNSPYKASSIIDFWSRWHMTLSRFIKDYIYIPLGGKTHNQMRNIFLTMSLVGVWHGSSLNFLAWGGIHGILIVMNHILRRYGPFFFMPSLLKILGVFILINTTWILFRALSLNDALLVFQQYIGISSIEGFHFGKTNIVITFFFLGGVFILPNIQDLFFKNQYLWSKYNILWSSFSLLLFIYTYIKMNHATPFIYFNF